MSLDESTRGKIDNLITSHPVMLFMKGNREAPQCGFSAKVVSILDDYLSDYETIDVLSNADIREGIKVYSSWPTIPQLYVGGEFLGGCDILTEMAGAGELFSALGVEPPETVVPTINVTDEAAKMLEQAATQNGGEGQYLHLSVGRDWQTSLSMAPQNPMDVRVDANGIILMVDQFSTVRADGISITLVETAEGNGFKVDNPNAPTLGEMSVQELKALMDSEESFEFLDVRTPNEFETARIPGAVLLDEAQYQRIMNLPKQTKIVFICHHGPRGVNAGQKYISEGFTNVHNITGGIEAWSSEIDSSVPRY
jgi:monothiol glutaredoxin